MKDLSSEIRTERPLFHSRQLTKQPPILLCSSATGRFGIFQLSLQDDQPTIKTLNQDPFIQYMQQSFADPLSRRRFRHQNVKLISLQCFSNRIFWFHLCVRPSPPRFRAPFTCLAAMGR